MLEINISVQRQKRRYYCRKSQSWQMILLVQSCKIFCKLWFSTFQSKKWIREADDYKLNDRNEAGILTARKDLDYIGRDELLEALKRVCAQFILCLCCEILVSDYIKLLFTEFFSCTIAAKRNIWNRPGGWYCYTRGFEIKISIQGSSCCGSCLLLSRSLSPFYRGLHRFLSVSCGKLLCRSIPHVLMHCVFIFVFQQTDIKSIRAQPNMRYAEISGRVFSKKMDYLNSVVRACARK